MPRENVHKQKVILILIIWAPFPAFHYSPPCQKQGKGALTFQISSAKSERFTNTIKNKHKVSNS
jgi:hypothetical protein